MPNPFEVWSLKEIFFTLLANNKPNRVPCENCWNTLIAFIFKRNEGIRFSKQKKIIEIDLTYCYLCLPVSVFILFIYVFQIFHMAYTKCLHFSHLYICMTMVFLGNCMGCSDRVKHLFSIKWIKLTDKMTKLCMIKQTINEYISISKEAPD